MELVKLSNPDLAASLVNICNLKTGNTDLGSRPCSCTQDLTKCTKHAGALLLKAEEAGLSSYPVDGGYGWVVVWASFMLQFISVGMAFSVGVYYVAFLEAFHERKGHTAWISSINTGLLFGAGPLASVLTNRFGHRAVVIAGGLLTSSGMFLSAYAHSIYYLYVTYGVLTGVGFCFVYIPSVVVVGLHFDKHRGLAMGIAVSGCGAGSLVFAPLLQLLVDFWGWRGALMISAGISAHACALGALLRPAQNQKQRAMQNHQESKDKITTLFELSLLKDVKFILFILNNILWNIGSLILFILIPDYAQHCGVNKNDSTYLLSTIGTCNFLGRVIVALIANHKRCNNVLLFVISTGITGLAIAAFPTTREFAILMTYAGLYGLFFGMQLGVLPIVTIELFGMNRVTSAYGYLMFGNGTGALIGPPIAGWLYDVTRVYEPSFYVGGGVTLLSAAVLVAIPLMTRREYRKRHQLHSVMEMDVQVESTHVDALVTTV